MQRKNLGERLEIKFCLFFNANIHCKFDTVHWYYHFARYSVVEGSFVLTSRKINTLEVKRNTVHIELCAVYGEYTN